MPLILFDFDGVLADSIEDMIRFAQESCNELGISHQVILPDLSMLESMSFYHYGRNCEVPDNLLENFVELCINKFASKKSPPALFEGMTKVLQELSKNNNIAIVTGNTSQNVKSFLREYKLETIVSAIHGVDEPGSKAEKILRAKEKLSAGEEPVFMVGDSVSDIKSAKSAGVISIAVSWGHQDVNMLAAAKPDYFIDTPSELIGIIKYQK